MLGLSWNRLRIWLWVPTSPPNFIHTEIDASSAKTGRLLAVFRHGVSGPCAEAPGWEDEHATKWVIQGNLIRSRAKIQDLETHKGKTHRLPTQNWQCGRSFCHETLMLSPCQACNTSRPRAGVSAHRRLVVFPRILPKTQPGVKGVIDDSLEQF